MTRIKKKWAVVAVVAAVFIGGGAAFAYWTQSGSGTGSAANGTTVPITVNQTSTISGLAPGLAPVPLSGNFDNPNPSAVYVGSVSATVTATSVVGCLPGDYVIGGTAPVNTEVASGTGVGSWTGLNVKLTDTGVSQNLCKGATITISYTSN
jgi:hypothetical protein